MKISSLFFSLFLTANFVSAEMSILPIDDTVSIQPVDEVDAQPTDEVHAQPISQPEQPVTIQPVKPIPAVYIHISRQRLILPVEAGRICPDVCQASQMSWTSRYRRWNFGTTYPLNSTIRSINNSACECR